MQQTAPVDGGARVRHDRAVSAARVHRLPPRRSGLSLWTMRFLGLLATGTLLAVGVAAALMVVPTGDGSDSALLGGAPAATPKAAATPAPRKHASKPRRPKLTAAQRQERRTAVAVLRDDGYRPVRLGDYRPASTLRVLIGRGEGGQRVFFFSGSVYLGNDSTEDSAQLRVLRNTRDTVTIGYRLFAQGDKSCCPHGGTARVRFRLKAGKLEPLGAIPTLESRRAPAD
jgi:hypothetical protein